jgi:5'-methylthioadenosine phosphorylase
MFKFGVIGGTGLYQIDEFTLIEEKKLSTPYGKPSDALVRGKLYNQEIVFLPRHGRGHKLLPTEVNYRANIWALKEMGVTHLLSISAVGSMKEEIKPGDIVLPDQFIDLTKHRDMSFFGQGCIAHVSFCHPLCPELTEQVVSSSKGVNATIHVGGTYICIEGPAFSSRAESLLYRTWGPSVIGMTNATEAKLAREAEIAMVTIALATDYDCWNEEEASVTADAIMEVLAKNAETAKAMVVSTIRSANLTTCSCHNTLATGLVTRPQNIPKETRENLAPIIQKYL